MKQGKDMPQEDAKILWNRAVTKNTMHMGLSCRNACRDVAPGQFVMLKTGGHADPLLRRPFSIHNAIVDQGEIKGIELLYKVVGPETKKMERLGEGDTVNLVAPLGQGFRFSGSLKKTIVAGGGIGIAPLVYLVSGLLEKGLEPRDILVLLGGRSKDDVLCADRFTSMGAEVRITTDDGSLGEKGFVTGLLAKALGESKPDMVFTCGPHGMLHAVADLCERKDVNCQVSVETLMACGICACLGCAVTKRTDDGSYMHVCKNGPVFNARDLSWD
jgi:dihydroorotate dehydrogenase electron transfer subunit